MDCDEPHLAPNEETQPIQWTEQRTDALVAAGSLWPKMMKGSKDDETLVNPGPKESVQFGV
jgi:hypothetical protein